MRRTINKAISFLDKYEFVDFGKNNKSLIFLVICIFTGMVMGSISAGTVNMEILHKLDFLFLNDFKERIGSSGIDIFVSSFSSLVIFVLLTEVSALSFFGAVLVPSMIFFKGIGMGITAGYLYLIYSLKGIAFYILILLPGIFVSSIGLILFAVGSFKFSCKYAQKLLPRCQEGPLWYEFKSHIRKSGYSLALLLISSLLDMGFMAMFSKFFEF